MKPDSTSCTTHLKNFCRALFAGNELTYKYLFAEVFMLKVPSEIIHIPLATVLLVWLFGGSVNEHMEILMSAQPFYWSGISSSSTGNTTFTFLNNIA